MTFRVNAWRIRIRRDQGTPYTTISVDAGDMDEHAVAVDTVQVSWSRPTPFAHPGPGSARFSVMVPKDSPDNALLTYDAQVEIAAFFRTDTHLGSSVPVARGWIQGFTRTSHGTRYRYNIELMDMLGRAAATTIGAAPWPHQPVNTRLWEINMASKAGFLINYPATNYGDVLARDVDNYNALDLLRESVPMERYIVESSTAFRLEVSDLADTSVPTMRTNGGLGMTRPPSAPPIGYGTGFEVPAAWIRDAPRVMSRAGLVSEVTYRIGLTYTHEGYTNTVKDGAGAFSSSRLTFFTDKDYQPSDAAKVAQRAQKIIDTAQTPALALAPTSFVMANVDDVGFRELLAIGTRDNRIIVITGGPADIGTAHLMTAATLTITGTTVSVDGVVLQPGPMFGIRPLQFSDLDTDLMEVQGRPTFAPSPFRIRHTSVVTTVAALQY